jgi:hypothetical protein
MMMDDIAKLNELLGDWANKLAATPANELTVNHVVNPELDTHLVTCYQNYCLAQYEAMVQRKRAEILNTSLAN